MYSIKGIEIENEGKLIPGILARWGQGMGIRFQKEILPFTGKLLAKIF
jgi:hypothetical protein